jgi:transcriptional regulator with GAF, ATPase, and Fis domain
MELNLIFYSLKPTTYDADHLSLLSRLQQPVTDSMEQLLNTHKVSAAHAPQAAIAPEGAGKMATRQGFEGIIGRSHLLLNVFDLITQVAPSDTFGADPG